MRSTAKHPALQCGQAGHRNGAGNSGDEGGGPGRAAHPNRCHWAPTGHRRTVVMKGMPAPLGSVADPCRSWAGLVGCGGHLVETDMGISVQHVTEPGSQWELGQRGHTATPNPMEGPQWRENESANIRDRTSMNGTNHAPDQLLPALWLRGQRTPISAATARAETCLNSDHTRSTEMFALRNGNTGWHHIFPDLCMYSTQMYTTQICNEVNKLLQARKAFPKKVSNFLIFETSVGKRLGKKKKLATTGHMWPFWLLLVGPLRWKF